MLRSKTNMDLDHSRTLLDTLGPLLKVLEKRGKGHVSLLPELVLLDVLAVHSALACQKIVKGLDP